VQAARLDDVREFFRRYYHPANASLALAGDITVNDALRLAERYFGDLPSGPAVPAVNPEPAALGSEVRLVLEDRVELPRLYLAWHTPALFDAGDAELDLLADVLANGRTSRLYRDLVYERRVAAELGASQSSRELSSYLQFVGTAAPGQRLAEIEAAVTAELDRIAAEGVTEGELRRVQAQAEAHFVYRLQTVGGFGGKSDQLNAYNVFVKDPGFFARDLERYRGATPEGLVAAARHLVAGRRVSLSVVPKGRMELALDGSSAAVVA
jgi:zinc protease